MAGIGFKLNRLFFQNKIYTDVLAILYSILTSAGPWIITTISLWIILNYIKTTNIYFNTAVIYSFIFSIIISGIFSMFFSRRISDLIYEKNYQKILPETLGIIVSNAIILIIFLTIFFSIKPQPFDFIIAFSYLTTSLTILWLISIVTIATEEINWYILSYIIMGISAILLSKVFSFSTFSEIYGYALGVNVGIVINFIIIYNSFGNESYKISFEWKKEIKNYWQLLFIGLLYYLSIWIDDIIVWNTQKFGEELIKGFKFSYIYDSPMFFSYLTIIPTITMFILILETRFYKKYKQFYISLIKGYVYSEILTLKENMEKELNQSISLTIKIQILVTTLMFTLNELKLLPISNEFSKPILRLGLIGAMLNGFFLMILLLILYFDFRNTALVLTLSVLSLNLVLSYILTQKIGYAALGGGYAISFLVGTLVSYNILKRRVKDIIKIEFFRQKLSIPEGKIIKGVKK
ncbi:hypothetical protein SU69_05085 [Thermosipho melanesiensis]|uniref:Membrane protein-like protein n=2 Tax=Thermosipho melanesiensis TaxID=46541 RepID=A6LLQ3_THEM4|nr:exopolysaccharide Pel transporter PelG [Thermosipho melanesiensis]ABR30854.1 membrane protein-like protein [Thermosipho melanesiensis BI429]APT73973.1 hypothetical protein BW47_05320 [Thermosipho melanesiensis]OOC35908.1 hypothetical protein SU68_05140 [Thermosipho melanesiensis]OOC38410.1 hypothetical protein SU69_05085 [Thermosipho melanesiensis]OOC38871.1 hypothetical protein SU70_05085 [Thermosipho melanesiensis]